MAFALPLVPLLAGGSTLAIGMTAASTVLGVMANNSANKANQAQAAAQQNELARQAGEEKRISAGERSDRVRQADKEFASFLAVSASTGGALGTVNVFRGAQEIGFLEGIDLARIDANSKARLGRIGADSASVGRRARSSAKNTLFSNIGTIAGGIGSGLSIRSQTEARNVQKELARNKT